MKYNKLGKTELLVSEICLGSMTWGTQNTVSEAHSQIDLALSHGVNFIDTAEMYPVNPRTAETQGDTERIIGEWFSRTKRRQEIVLATKVSGEGFQIVRDGAPISPKTIDAAIEASLRSLKTDYIDLYQLHWPNRGSYMFRKNWTYDPTGQINSVVLEHMMEVLEHIKKLQKQGKIIHFGLSNESAWGTMQWLSISSNKGLPRAVSVQNEYSLLCRLFDLDMAEVAHHERIGLLAFSPLAAGLLTGKYSKEKIPPGSRRSFVQDLGGRINDTIWSVVDEYLKIAEKHELTPSQMALAWALQRPFMTSVIIGATNNSQLTEAINSVNIDLNNDILSSIAEIHRRHPMPF